MVRAIGAVGMPVDMPVLMVMRGMIVPRNVSVGAAAARATFDVSMVVEQPHDCGACQIAGKRQPGGCSMNELAAHRDDPTVEKLQSSCNNHKSIAAESARQVQSEKKKYCRRRTTSLLGVPVRRAEAFVKGKPRTSLAVGYRQAAPVIVGFWR
jgi:hypothetical protein